MNGRDLAARFKLRRAGRDWRGACPACGYRDAFTLTERDGRALGWCASCQDKAAIGALLRDGRDWKPPTARAPGGPDKRDLALRLWAQARPVAGTPAETYLATRHIPEAAGSPSLRFMAACPHPLGCRLPALLALFVDATGAPRAVHRTFLRPDGVGKADVEPQKASLGPVWGAAIRLQEVAAELVIAEGIETVASAGLLLGLPAWAAFSAGNLGRGLILPESVRRVVIAVDRDPTGERAADEAAKRWQAERRHVRIALPNRSGADFNDVLAAKVRNHD